MCIISHFSVSLESWFDRGIRSVKRSIAAAARLTTLHAPRVAAAPARAIHGMVGAGAELLLLLLLLPAMVPGTSAPEQCRAMQDAMHGIEQPSGIQLLELGACLHAAARETLQSAERSLRRAHSIAPSGGAMLVLGRSSQYEHATAVDTHQPQNIWDAAWSMAHSTGQRAQFFAQGNDDLLVSSLLADLHMFSDVSELDGRMGDVESFVRDLVYYFSVPAFGPTAESLAAFFPFHPLISNLVALTTFRTTDAAVASLVRPCDLVTREPDQVARRGCAGLEKAMILYSARNSVRLDPSALFRHNPGFASLWYTSYYWLGYGALANPTAFANMKRHMQESDLPARLYMEASSNFALDCLLNVYYMCTYVDPLREKHTRQLINTWTNSNAGVAGLIRGTQGAQISPLPHAPTLLSAQNELSNRPAGSHNDRRILVIDAFWVHTYSSHRVVYRMIDKLQQAYHVDLLRASTHRVSMVEGFQTVYEMPRLDDGSVLFRETIQWIVDQRYDAVMYPSISMDRVTLWLSHFRLAPIQVASYGQPVSTHGAQIDYWLAGEAVGPLHHMDFSERLLLLPDMGILHTYPSHYEWGNAQGQSTALGTETTKSPDLRTTHSIPSGWFCPSVGMGGDSHVLIDHDIKGADESEQRLIINTQAAVHKTNAEWIAMLVRIVKQAAPQPLAIRFFPNLRAHDAATSAAFSSELKAAFNGTLQHITLTPKQLPICVRPEQTARSLEIMLLCAIAALSAGTHADVEILCPPGPQDFIAMLAAGDVYLDSFPFGGCSSIIDALLVDQPVVSLSGTKYSNRCGPHLLETAGLDAGVAHSERDYFRTAVRAISAC